MLRGSLSVLTALVALAGCPGGDAGIGDACGGNDDCDGTLQCLNHQCARRCVRAPECGDGFACDEHGFCQPALGQAGDACTSEVDCTAGLSCQLDGASVDETTGRLLASCTAQSQSHPAGHECDDDAECTNGTCALGQCVDLCQQTRDCGPDTSCMTIPRVLANGAPFAGCLPSQGSVTWSIPVISPSAEVLLPVPAGARSAELVMSIDDPSQKVGAASVLSPAGVRLYTRPCSPPILPTDPRCDPSDILDQYFGSFGNKLRHLPAVDQSVLALPQGSTTPIELGAYRVQVSSFRSNGAPGSAVPRVTAVVQLGAGTILDLHFYFLNLEDHACAALTGNAKLDAHSARAAPFFQYDYLHKIGSVFDQASVKIGTVTFDDIPDHPELDGLDVANVGSLLALGAPAGGINVFFVRSLSPVGLQAFGPNPGPAGVGGTRQSGIVIALDTLCYRDWISLAKLTAHEIGRYMGLYHNVELETAQHPTWRDPIDDSDDSSDNLMYFSELGGMTLSPGQRDVLTRSSVLR